MIRASLVALAPLALVAAASPVRADDPRLVERLYDPAEVVRINGKARVQATIMFGEDETIENVAIGDSQSWQVTPNKRANLLFVKPLSPTASTNMTVVTNRRTYLFDLVASPKHRPLYVLQFTYPVDPEEEAARNLAQAERASESELAAASDPYAVVDPAALNFAWTASGKKALLPTQAFDDGEATFLTWPQGAAVPAILVTDEDGTEGPVNFTVRGDTVIVDGVPAAIILRAGKDSALLTNTAPSAQPGQDTARDPSLAKMENK